MLIKTIIKEDLSYVGSVQAVELSILSVTTFNLMSSISFIACKVNGN